MNDTPTAAPTATTADGLRIAPIDDALRERQKNWPIEEQIDHYEIDDDGRGAIINPSSTAANLTVHRATITWTVSPEGDRYAMGVELHCSAGRRRGRVVRATRMEKTDEITCDRCQRD